MSRAVGPASGGNLNVPCRRPLQTRIQWKEAELNQPPCNRRSLASLPPAGLQAQLRGGRPQADEVPVVLGELAWDPAPAAEMGCCAPAHAAGT